MAHINVADMQTFNLKNIKTDGSVENLLSKIWIVATV